MAVPTGDACIDVMAKLVESIEDERKAGPDYQKLATDVKDMFCGGTCPKGFIAQIGLQTLAVDENKHHDFLVQLLAAVEQECKERPFFPGAGVELSLVRSSVPGEWVVRYYENGKLNDDKSYYTDDKADAEETMKMMKKRIREGLP